MGDNHWVIPAQVYEKSVQRWSWASTDCRMVWFNELDSWATTKPYTKSLEEQVKDLLG